MKVSFDDFPTGSLAEFMRTRTFLGELDGPAFDGLLESVDCVRLGPGETLIRQGDVSKAVYFVIEGECEAVISGPGGGASTVGRIGPGEPVGEIQTLAGGRHTASVVSLAEAVLARVPRPVLETLLESSPALMSALAGVARRRLLHNQLSQTLPTLFGPLDEAMLQDIEGKVEWLHIQGGEVLFREDDPGDALYIVLYGRLRVVAGAGGKGERVLGEAGRGECVGEMALFTDEPRSATVYAIRDSELVRIARPVFEGIVRQYPQLTLSITRLLIGRLRANNSRSCALKAVTNVALFPVSRDVPLNECALRIASALSPFGLVLHLNSAIVDRLLHTPGAAASPEGGTGSIRLLSWLGEQEMKHAFIIFEADPGDTPWTRRCMRHADHVLMTARASAMARDGVAENQPAASGQGLVKAKRSLVMLHEDGSSMPRGTREWLERYRVEDHHHIRRDRDGDFQRLGRFIAGRTTSLVLSGGGARGLAHIGVIKALREAGTPIDMIGGASMGAVIASACAMDQDHASIYQKAVETFVRKNPFSDYTLPFISLVRCRELDSMIGERMGDVQIEDLWVNYFCVSSNLSTAELVVHRKGPLAKAVRASVSYPGITVPVVEGEHLLVDGGVLNNLPVDVMRGCCQGKIIAADVTGEEDLKVTGSAIPSPWKVFLSRVLPFTQSIRIPNIFDVLMRTVVLSSVQRRNQVIRDVDLYLRPPVHDFRLLDFKAIDRLIDIGYRHTREKLSE
jgi:predicted acylesterase/phospholipase RssA/CRP-like cAMP-binding protein